MARASGAEMSIMYDGTFFVEKGASIGGRASNIARSVVVCHAFATYVQPYQVLSGGAHPFFDAKSLKLTRQHTRSGWSNCIALREWGSTLSKM